MNIAIKSIKFILKVLPKKHKLKLIGVGFLLLLNSLLELIGLGALLPVFSVLLEDNVVEKYRWAAWLFNLFSLSDERQLIVVLAIGLLGIVIVKNILGLWIAQYNSTFALSLYKEFSLRLHEHYYQKGFSFFKTTNSNIIVRNLKIATNYFSNNHVLGILNLLNEIIVLVFIVAFIAFYDVNILGLLLITVLPIFYIFYRWVRLKSIKLGEVKNIIEPEIFKNLYQSIFGFVDAVITGSQKMLRGKISKNLDDLVEVDIKTTVYNLAPTRVIETSLMLAIAVIISFGVFYLPSKLELLKLLGIFAVAGYRIMPSINRMMIAINGLNQTQWIFEILEPLQDEKNENLIIEENTLSFHNQLKLQNISFYYPESSDLIFDDFSLTINKGEVVGLVGPSGAGKTTLMNILLGFLQPTKGNYFIDDTKLNNANLKSFYKKIGYVQQQVYLIDGSVSENVAFGCEKHNIDNKKIEEVLRKASLWETIKNLPNGVDELIGENGTKMSGGQRQRIGIARALYYDAEILFFDEATSSLDTETEKEITDAIHELSDGNLTLIIIAHRLSTINKCDRVYEIKNRTATAFKYSESLAEEKL